MVAGRDIDLGTEIGLAALREAFRRTSRETGIRVEQSGRREQHLNRSLDDVIELLAQEIERLKESLETYRLSKHPDRGDLIRWHVHTLDKRQDTLEELQTLLLAQRDPAEVH